MSKKDLSENLFQTQEILRRVRNGDIPPTWCVFQTSRKKLGVMLLGSCITIYAILAFLAAYLLINPDHHPTVPVRAIYIILTIIGIFVAITIFLSLFTWAIRKNVVLVLTSEEIIYGDIKKLNSKMHISFTDVASIHIDGASIILQKKGTKWIKKQIDCRLYKSPSKEVASVILEAFRFFRAKETSRKKK